MGRYRTRTGPQSVPVTVTIPADLFPSVRAYYEGLQAGGFAGSINDACNELLRIGIGVPTLTAAEMQDRVRAYNSTRTWMLKRVLDVVTAMKIELVELNNADRIAQGPGGET